MVDDLLNHAYVMKPPEKPKRIGVREFPGWWANRYEESGAPKGMGTPNPFL